MKPTALLLLVVCSIAALAQEPPDSGMKQNVLALEHAWDQALERGDVKALNAIFDNSLIYIDYDGSFLTKAEYLSRVKQNDIHLQEIVTEEMNVQLFGSTAIVVGTYRAKGLEKGKAYVHRGRFMDTWVLEGKNWICVASGATPILH
jgi:ketosteroid isomerase-like protein